MKGTGTIDYIKAAKEDLKSTALTFNHLRAISGQPLVILDPTWYSQPEMVNYLKVPKIK